jgi:hypothetical protein
MKSLALISLFAVGALAQSSLIPTGISDKCEAYLTKLNADTTLTTCASSINTATSAFAPGSSSSASSSTINSALNNLCSANNQCSEGAIRTILTELYSACQDDLVAKKNKQVVQIYDTVYTIPPMIQAACCKDDSGRYCATQIAGSAPSASSLYNNAQSVITPNFDTLKSSNGAFLFLSSSLPKEQLCTSCTRSIITAYVSFESNQPYAPGISNSELLGGQAGLYQAVQDTCGATFLNGALQAAGGLAGGITSSFNSPADRASVSGGLAALVGAVGVAFAAAL